MQFRKVLAIPLGATGLLCLYALYDRKKDKWRTSDLSLSFRIPSFHDWRCSTNPNCLLSLAQSDKLYTSLLGIRGLVALKNLPEWKRRSLWQRADASVYAAMLLVDASAHSYPLHVYYGGPDWESLHEEYLNLLENLYESGSEECPRYHTEEALQTQKLPVTNAELSKFSRLEHQPVGREKLSSTILLTASYSSSSPNLDSSELAFSLLQTRGQVYPASIYFFELKGSYWRRDKVIPKTPVSKKALKNGYTNIAAASQLLRKAIRREIGEFNDQLCNHHSMLDARRLISYLSALGIHSLWPDTCRVMYQSKILNTLWQSWHFPQFIDEPRIRCLILKIISNIVLALPESKEVLARQGWLEELSESRSSSNFELQLLANNVLENLAARFPDAPVFQEGVYLLQGSIWDGKHYVADIVFLHGLRGRVFRTWRQKEFIRRKDVVALNDFLSKRPRTRCWVKDWLPKDLPYPVRLLAVDYDSFLSGWSLKCPSCYGRCSLELRSRELASKLAKAGVGKRPIIWVSHSMGGLIVKEMLRNLDADSTTVAPTEKSLLNNTIGCVFYGTPHLGSHLATVSTTGALNTFVLPSAEVNMLKEGSPYLAKLHEDFLSIRQRKRIPCLSFVETIPTRVALLKWNVMLVTENSASSVPGQIHKLRVTVSLLTSSLPCLKATERNPGCTSIEAHRLACWFPTEKGATVGIVDDYVHLNEKDQ